MSLTIAASAISAPGAVLCSKENGEKCRPSTCSSPNSSFSGLPRSSASKAGVDFMRVILPTKASQSMSMTLPSTIRR